MEDPSVGDWEPNTVLGRKFFETKIGVRRTDLRIIRPSTPLENIRQTDIQSPSALPSDHMLLPKMS